MGRKIKGKKHRGVRDPEKQRQIQFASIKDKINAPPANPDEQHVPKSLSHIINLKEKVQTGVISLKRKRKPRRKLGPVSSHPHGFKYNESEKSVPFFQQKEGEPDKKFMWRVHKICQSVMEEAAFENKYGVNVKRNQETGEVNVVKREKDQLEVYMKELKKEKKSKGKKKSSKSDPKLTKSQKRQIKIKEKKQSKLEFKEDEFKNFEDTVRFGEVVHGPPTLSAPRRVKVDETPRPGKKDLLLKSILHPDQESQQFEVSKKVDKLNKVSSKVIDRKGKRKDLPHALRRQLDKQQQEVIEAYKKLKAKQYKA